MQARANKSMYWPGIKNHIKTFCDNCKSCSYNPPSQSKEPLISPPQSSIKTAKRMIWDNTFNNGSINNDKIAKAVMQYCNTPLPAISLSPSQILFHRELQDFTPSHPTHYQLHKDWIITHEQ